MINKYTGVRLLVICCLILNISSYSTMAQNIAINNNVVNHNVIGNGTPPNGAPPSVVAASNNAVTLSGGTGVNGFVVGGIKRGGIVEDVVSNTVSIDINNGGLPGAGVITVSAYGGRAEDALQDSNAINNRLSILNGIINVSGVGGIAARGRAGENVLEMTGGSVDDYVCGGLSTRDALNNRLTISGGNIGVGIVVADGVYGGRSSQERAEGNVMEMTGGVVVGNAYGGWGQLDALNNKLTISGGNINGAIGARGGYSLTGRAEGNVMEMTGGVVAGNAYGGWGQLDALNNKLTISGGNINGAIGARGGYSLTGRAEKNVMEMTGGVVAGDACGGWSQLDALNNKVTISGGVVNQGAYGGWSQLDALNNKLTILAGTTIQGGAEGGHSVAGRAEGNVMEMTGGVVNQDVYGGRGQLDALNNKLTISGGNIHGLLFGACGGYSLAGRAEGNVMEMTGGVVNNDVYGGWSQLDALNNKLTILAGTIQGGAYGGYSMAGRAEGNVMEMTGGVVVGNAYGGWGQLDALNNKLTISGGNINGAIGAYGGHSVAGRAEGNVMEMTGGTITNNACGGYGNGNGDAINNKLKISSGNIGGGAHGGYSQAGRAERNELEMAGGTIGRNACGGISIVGGAINNRITITNGNIEGLCVGGVGAVIATDNQVKILAGNFRNEVNSGRCINGEAKANILEIAGGVFAKDVISGYSRTSNANENKVIISGGEFFADVYGGKSKDGGAVGNTVEISGDPKFSTNTFIYGGFTSTASVADVFTNNTLNIKTNNIEVKGIRNFQFLNFYNLIKNRNAMLTCAQQVNIEGVNINVEMNIDEDVDADDKYILIKSYGGFEGSTYKEVKVKQGVLARYKAALFINNNTDLGIVITDEYINNRAEILTQGKGVNTEIINKGLDLVVDRGIRLAKDANIVSNGVAPFAAFKGGKSNLSYTGSNINIEDIGVMGGVAKELNMEGTKAMVGTFVENGRASYSLAKEIEGVDVEAVGSTNYVGFGVLATVDMVNEGYLEGSFRLGKYDVDYNTDDLDLEKKKRITSDYSCVYLGGHVGVGRVYKLNKKINMDVSAKFLFMYQAEKDLKLSSGDNLKYESVKSGRVRIGAKADYGLSKRKLRNIRPYAGINYEHEVMGQIEAVTIDIALPTVDLKYGVWLGELGVRKDIGNFNVDCSVIKYVGREDGIDAMVRARYCFDKENITLSRLVRKALKRSKYSSRVSGKSLTKLKSKAWKIKKYKK